MVALKNQIELEEFQDEQAIDSEFADFIEFRKNEYMPGNPIHEGFWQKNYVERKSKQREKEARKRNPKIEVYRTPFELVEYYEEQGIKPTKENLTHAIDWYGYSDYQAVWLLEIYGHASKTELHAAIERLRKEIKARPKPKKPFKKPENKRTKAVKSTKEAEQMALFFKTYYSTTANVFVHLFNKSSKEQRFYPLAALKDPIKLTAILKSSKFSANTDLMYSLSTYKTMQTASSSNVYGVPLIQVDVDYRKIPKLKNKTPKQIWSEILDLEVGMSIPYPTAIEYGHQLRLLYAIDDLYIKKGSNKVEILVNRITRTFAKRLKGYGAEGLGISSHARIVGSINSKDGSIIQLESFGYSYTVEELKEKWMDPVPTWYSEWKSKPRRKTQKIHHMHNEYSLNISRINDLKRIVEYYDGEIDGRRFICFQVRNHAMLAGMSANEAKQLMFEVNAMFKRPLREKVIEQDTRNIERKQYLYKNETILDWLDITPDEEEKLELTTIISTVEKKRRDRVRKAAEYRAKTYGDSNYTEKDKITERRQKIKDLLAAGLSKNDIVKQLQLSESTVKRDIRFIKHNM